MSGYILNYLFLKLPRSVRSILSRLFFKPHLGKKVRLLGWIVFSPGVEIGDYTFIRDSYFLKNVTIGKYCSIAGGLAVGLGSHPIEKISMYYFNIHEELAVPHTYIGNDVWIGERVTIKSGVNVGNGAVIGSGAVVTHDVPPYTVVGGVPAKILKYRFDQETIDKIENLHWWDWDHSKLIREFTTHNDLTQIDYLTALPK